MVIVLEVIVLFFQISLKYQKGNDDEVVSSRSIQNVRLERKRPFDPNKNDKRKATLMKHIDKRKARGIRPNVQFDEKDQSLEEEEDALMSWTGMLDRRHILILTRDWGNKANKERKAKVWKEVNEAFDIEKLSETLW